MQIFISWSGERSKQVGLLLKDWIKCVLQISKPWMSEVDIDRGSVWFSEIGKALDGCVNGIICLTKGNLLKPWLLFEAGALAKGLTSSRVCTFLVDLQPGDIGEPLSQFNHTFPSKDSMRKLVTTLNNRLGENALSIDILNMVFDTYWPLFLEKFQEIIKRTEEEKVPPRSEKDVMGEVLNTIRRIDKRLSSVEGVISDNSFEINSNNKRFIDDGPIDDGLILMYLVDALKRGIPTDEVRKIACENMHITQARARRLENIAMKILSDSQSS